MKSIELQIVDFVTERPLLTAAGLLLVVFILTLGMVNVYEYKFEKEFNSGKNIYCSKRYSDKGQVITKGEWIYKNEYVVNPKTKEFYLRTNCRF